MTNHQHQKGWISGNTKMSPVLKVVTNYHQRKPGVGIRIGSVSGDGSRSWTRMSNGLNKFVRDLTEDTRILGDDEKKSASTGRPVAQRTRIIENSRMKADKPAEKAKPRPISSHSSSFPTCIPIPSRRWIREPKDKDFQSFPVSKRVIALLRHGSLPRDEHGAIEFLEVEDGIQVRMPKFCLLVNSILDRSRTQKAEDKGKDFSIVLVPLANKFFASELSKVIQKKIPWIRLYRTVWWFPATSGGTSIMCFRIDSVTQKFW